MRFKFLIAILFIVIIDPGSRLQAQITFLPFEESIHGFPIATNVTFNQQLLTARATLDIGFRQATVQLSKWNGQFWVSFPGFSAEQFQFSSGNRMALCGHGNELYLGGSFNNADRSKTGLVKWNGNFWETVAGGIESDYIIHREISILDMVSYNNDLFVCGEFNIANGKPVHNFVALKGNDWESIETNKGMVNDLEVIKDTLYAAGLFNQIDGQLTTNLGANFKGNWSPLSSPTTTEFIGLASFGDQLVAITRDKVFLKNASSWLTLSNQWDFNIEFLGNAVEFEGKLYIAGTFRNSAGIKMHLIVWDGIQWKTVVSGADILPSGEQAYYINKKDKELIFSGKISRFFGKDVNHFVNLFPGKSVVTGKIFNDLNEDCKYSIGETPVANSVLMLNNDYYTSTDQYGNYSLVLDNNSKSTIKIFPGDDHEAKCSGELIVMNTSLNDTSLHIDIPFRVKPQPPSPRYSLSSATGFKARHGHKVHYTIQCTSPLQNFPLELNLEFDERLTFIESNLQPDFIANNKLIWTLQQNGDIQLIFLVNHDQFEVGDSLKYLLSGYPKATSGFSATVKILNQLIVSAFDPNQKQCDRTEIEEGKNSLEYHIQFQNLGNDSAVNINVVDTISRDLPVEFIKIKDYSERHRKNVSYKVRDHAIIWSFKEIYLPSKSSSGDALSSGYISFQSAVGPGLKAGDIISNKAQIYFDYQDPVSTNRVVTKIIKRSTGPFPKEGNDKLILYPNPARQGKFLIEFSPYLIKKVEVYDMAGRTLYKKELDGVASNLDMDIGNLSSGIYTINVTHSVGSVSGKLAVQK